MAVKLVEITINSINSNVYDNDTNTESMKKYQM